MGGERPVFQGDERLACCGHARRLHVPRCGYWFPGTRDDPPHLCGCDGGAAGESALDGPEVAS